MSDTTTTTPPASPAVAKPNRVGQILSAQAMQIVLVWLAIVVIFAVMAPGSFFTSAKFVNTAVSVAILAVLGVGTTFFASRRSTRGEERDAHRPDDPAVPVPAIPVLSMDAGLTTDQQVARVLREIS